MGPFGKSAQKYYDLGLSIIPLRTKEKRPALPSDWQKYCDQIVPPALFKVWRDTYDAGNLGLALGTRIGNNRQLIAIDIDDDELVEPVRLALPYPGAEKKGKKGLTIIGQADALVTNRKFKRIVDGRPNLRPGVELLAHGSQTVLPPSIHPDGPEYKWVEGRHLNGNLATLPFINEAVLDEIAAICGGKGEHFHALNTMTWLGLGGGGNTHDVCVAAVAFMVARGWSDADIHARVMRSKKLSVERHGDKFDWPDGEHTIQEWIVSAREKGMSNRGQGKRLPAERIMADWGIATLGGRDQLACVNSRLRSYKEGHWPLVEVPNLMKSMYDFDEALREREAKAAVSIIHTVTEVHDFGHTPGTEPRDDPKRQRICLTNGTLNIRTGNLEVWAPEHELLHQLNFAWDDEAHCPTYDRVVAQTFNDDVLAIRLWDEFCALTLVDDMSFQKVLFLRGPGGNGKGTIARVLRSMHAQSAVGSVAITDLNDERKRTSLVGKLVNISGEQSRLNTVADTYLKKITGGDPIDIRRLYGETQNNVALSVRFLELVNEMPATMDSSYALRRRLILLDCPNKVAKPDLDMDKKLYLERPGILRRWADALIRLYARGDFEIPEASTEEVSTYMIENDPVAYWMQDRIDPNDKGTGSRELYADFNSWYEHMGYRYPMPEVMWGRRLTALGYPSISTRRDGRVIRTRRICVRPGHEAPI